MCKTKYNRPDSGTALVPQLQYESFELTIIYRDTNISTANPYRVHEFFDLEVTALVANERRRM